MEPPAQLPGAIPSVNIYRTVREVLESAPAQGIDTEQLVAELRVRGFPHMGPRAAFEVVGRRLPPGAGSNWCGTAEAFAVLRRLEAEVDQRAARRTVAGADLPVQRRAGNPVRAAEPATASPPSDAAADADVATSPAAQERRAAQPEAPVPAGLAVTLRVLLRDGPATLVDLHARVAAKGWSDINSVQVEACLRRAQHWFGAAGDLWHLAPETETVDVSKGASRPSRAKNHRSSVRPPGDTSVFAGARRTGDLLRPQGDEWALPGSPEEPHLQHEYLVRYREVRQRQSGLLEVWIAGKGELYHFDRDCNLLKGGQAVAVARGQGLSWVRSVTEHEAQRLQRQSCSRCAGGTGSGRRR